MGASGKPPAPRSGRDKTKAQAARPSTALGPGSSGSPGTGIERELKFPVEGLDGVRERLLAMEAERIGPSSFEDNWVLDRGGELEAQGCVLRLRTDGHGAHVTLKGPRHFDGDTKVRAEIQFDVNDRAASHALFEALGYRVVRRYQKKREEWRLGSVVVALDHTPIGDFAEFEGEKAAVVARRCGFGAAKPEPRSYLQLYNDWRRDHPEAPAEMTFPADETR